MDKKLDLKVYNMMLENNPEKINDFIKSYRPFIIKTISNLKHSYVDIDNDEEYSIALSAFLEALNKYKPEKGSFIGFARLVIESRLKSYFIKVSKLKHLDIEDMQIADIGPNQNLVDDIKAFEQALLEFGIDFEILISASPKHNDTRQNAISLGYKTSQVPAFVKHIYEKKRLPITLISNAFSATVKVIKKSKLFILSVVIIYDKKLTTIQDWLK